MAGNDIRSGVGFFCLTALLCTLIGNVLIWVKGVTDYPQGLYAVILVGIAALNLASFLLGFPLLVVVAAALMFAVVDVNICSARAADVDNHGTLLAGYIIALVGSFASFIAFPIDWARRPEFQQKRGNVGIVVFSIAILVGSLLLWTDKSTPCGLVTAVWVAIIYFVSGLWDFELGLDLAFFLSCLLTTTYQPFARGTCTGTCLAGFIIIYAALILIIFMQCYCQAKDNNADTGKLKHPIGVVGLVCVIVCLVGCVMIWSTNTHYNTAREGYVVALLLVVSILNILGFVMSAPIMCIAAASFIFAIVQENVDNIYWHGSHWSSEEDVRLGYILAMVGSLCSFVLFPVVWARPEMTEEHKTPVIVGLLLLAGSIIGWHSYCAAGWVGILYLASSLLEFPAGTTLSFLAALVLLPGYTPLSQWSPVVVVFVGLLMLAALHLFKKPERTHVFTETSRLI